MSHVKDASDIGFATAVAAAAYAVTLQEEEDLPNQNKRHEQVRHPTAKIRSKRGDSMNKPTYYSRISGWLSGKEAKDERQSGSTRFEHGQTQIGRRAPSTIKPTASFSGKGNGTRRTTDSTRVETKADAWERARMDKIRERYEKTMSSILDWENGEKSKANRQLERKESDLKRRQERASWEHHNGISKINKITGEARALAEERRRNDESTTLQKAKKMQSTGRVPHPCFCF